MELHKNDEKKRVLRVFALRLLWLLALVAAPLRAQNTDVQAACAPALRATLGPAVSWTSDPRWAELAYDPAHKGITENSEIEAMVGLSLERDGRLPGPIRRDPTGRSEFVDAQGVMWDVKGFRSFTPNGERMDMKEAIQKIDEEIRGGENLILDSRSLTPEDRSLLEAHVRMNSLTTRVLWFP